MKATLSTISNSEIRIQAEPSLLFVTAGGTRVTCPEAESRKWQGLIDSFSLICVCVCVCVEGVGRNWSLLPFNMWQFSSQALMAPIKAHSSVCYHKFWVSKPDMTVKFHRVEGSYPSPSSHLVAWSAHGVFCSCWVAIGGEIWTHQPCDFSGWNFNIHGVKICSLLFLLAN